jgi:hypothetical protein
MRLRYIFLSLIFVVFILLLIFLFVSNSNDYNPNGFELNVSESILPNVRVYVLDDNKNIMNVIDENEFFFIQQRGLPFGTVYSFRVVGERGEVLKPVYETYTARDADWVEANNYYLQIRPGNQTVELLTIKEGIGTIVARTNLSVLNFDKIIRNNCNHLISEPAVDEDGWSRESKIAECVTNIAVKFNKIDICGWSYRIFNITNADDCIRNYAITTKDISVCDFTSMPKSRGFCKAKVTDNWIECRKISCDISCAMESLETQQDLCIQWYAIENRNAILCNEIKSQAYNMKEVCLNLTTGS